MKEQLLKIYEQYKKYCQVINVYPQFYTTQQNDGSYHLEYSDGEYHYGSVERGQEYDRKITTNTDEIIYWLMSDRVWSLASEYELNNRVCSQDSRRILFSKQIELMSLLNPEWANKKQKEIDLILEKAPFYDKKSFY